MARKFIFETGQFYHLYNRGTEKRNIFLDHNDRERFLLLLHVANSTETVQLSDYPSQSKNKLWEKPLPNRLVHIGAYCLMPNHVHLLVKEVREGGISKFGQKLFTAYTMYFNTKHERDGRLFQGTFKAKGASDDNYLRYLFAYIHLNPIRIKDPESWEKKTVLEPENAKFFLNTYPYSSYLDYLTQGRTESVILNKKSFPEYFETPRNFEEYTYDWLNFPGEVQPRG